MRVVCYILWLGVGLGGVVWVFILGIIVFGWICFVENFIFFFVGFWDFGIRGSLCDFLEVSGFGEFLDDGGGG